MFFYLSKILWFLVNPGNLLLMGLIVGVILLWTRWRRAGHILLGFCTLLALVVSVVPVGKSMQMALENRFPMNLE